MVKYKFDEDGALDELRDYIDSTYAGHYATDKYQATDIIIDSGFGEGFCMGNIIKYSKRYGRKNGKNRDDIMKILHYAIIMLHVQGQENDDEVK